MSRKLIANIRMLSLGSLASSGSSIAMMIAMKKGAMMIATAAMMSVTVVMMIVTTDAMVGQKAQEADHPADADQTILLMP